MDTQSKLEAFKSILSTLFGGQTPPPLIWLVSALTLLGLLLYSFWGLLYVVAKIWQLWGEKFAPVFYGREQRVAANERQRFAEHVKNELNRLNAQTEWRDFRYGELEAEVEIENSWRSASSLGLPFRKFNRLRREKSLILLRRYEEAAIESFSWKAIPDQANP